VALSRLKHGFESRWGRHHCYQFSAEHAVESKPTGEPDRVSPTLDAGRKRDRSREQFTEADARFGDIPAEPLTPRDEVPSQSLLEVGPPRR
jgi:hypothetical protein